MCGICGVLDLERGPERDPSLLGRMVAALHHRGPDQTGCYRDDQIELGHARLSIIDLAGGTQPLCNETEEIWLVFNGEIYNYLELRDELRAAGHRFRSRSDTESIVHAYEQWGPDCVERFNGQYAFALWDRPRQRLMLARDPVGIRPLYYARAGSRFVFASEMKALLQDSALPRAIDPQGLSQVFSFWAPVAPRTPLAGVSQLEPGSLLLVDQQGETRRRSWQPAFCRSGSPRPYADEAELGRLSEQLRDRLEQATKLRMLRADVPVGVYVSGGIDSSVIGALVRRFHRGPLQTFSLRFAHQDFDEGAYQREMVTHLGTEHAEVSVDYRQIGEAFYDVVWFAEAPLLRAAPAPLLLLSRLVRERGYKVVLTGEGADEFLGGYDIFREAKVRRFWARAPRSELRPLLLERLYPWLTRAPAQARALQRAFFGRGLDRAQEPIFSHLPRWQSARSLQRLFSAELRHQLSDFDPIEDLVTQLPPAMREWEPLGQAQYLEIATLLSGYLLASQGDRMLMGNSVEGRFPFLDPEVMAFANALPPEAKLRVLAEKYLLKRAAADLVPASILQRAKQPYRAPDAQSFVQSDAPEYVQALLSRSAVEQAGLFDPDAAQRLVGKLRNNPASTPSNSDNMALVGLLSSQLLHHFFVRGERLACQPVQAFDRVVTMRSAGS